MPYSQRTMGSLQQRFNNVHTLNRILAGDQFDFQGASYAVAHFRNKPSELFKIDKQGGVTPGTLDLTTLIGNLGSVSFKNPPKSNLPINAVTTNLRKAIQGDDFEFGGTTRAITHYAYVPATLNEVTPTGHLLPTTLDLADLVKRPGDVTYPPATPRALTGLGSVLGAGTAPTLPAPASQPVVTTP